MNRRFCVAPMMGWTDRHFRYFFRLISRRAVLYSEMLAAEAVIYGKRERYLRFHPAEQPLAMQLGGNDPRTLARAAAIVEEFGYSEINLNVGCPSRASSNACVGAALMKQPQLVAECVAAMQQAVKIPVSVKSRIGVDEQEGYEALAHFVDTIRQAGGRVFIVHARKAELGLNTKDNREIPPLRYELVHQLKRDFPELTIVINGGIADLEQAQQQLAHVDGVMVGRKAYKEPYTFVATDNEIFGDSRALPGAPEILRLCLPYVEEELAQGTPLRDILRHQVGLYRYLPAAKAFRRHIAIETHRAGAGIEVYQRAVEIAEDLSRPRLHRPSPCALAARSL